MNLLWKIPRYAIFQGSQFYYVYDYKKFTLVEQRGRIFQAAEKQQARTLIEKLGQEDLALRR